jgi:Domain of unknown function (DUF1868)
MHSWRNGAQLASFTETSSVTYASRLDATPHRDHVLRGAIVPYERERNDAFAEHFTETGKDGPPRHLNVRFDTASTFLPQAGNTVVCHVIDGSATSGHLFARAKH